MVSHPAFELLKKHKEVKPEVEALIIKQSRGRITTEEMVNVFEKGITGQYGKLYSADAQTLTGWIDSYLGEKNSNKNYLHTGLVDPSTHITHPNYPPNLDSWHKEVNKCYTAFLNGVKEDNFHADCYDRLMLDGRINQGDCNKYFINKTDQGFKEARQSCLRDYFSDCKKRGWTHIYFIS